MTGEIQYLDAMRLVARGDENALGLLYDRYAKPVYSLACQMTGNEREAQEIVQDVFLSVWKSAPSFDPERGSVFTWMVTLTRNKSTDRLRKASRRLPALVDWSDVESVTESVDASANPAESAWHRERAGIVRSRVNELPEEQRSAIMMAFFEGLTHEQIAERNRQPVGTVKSRIRIGLSKLRDQMKGEVRA